MDHLLLVHLVSCLCSLEYLAAGFSPYDATRYILEDVPQSTNAPGFSRSLTPETAYGYVIAQLPLYQHQEYAPAFWQWTDIRPLYRVSVPALPSENEVYAPSFKEPVILPGSVYFNPQPTFESNSYFSGVNPKPTDILRNPTFSPVTPFDGAPRTYSGRYPHTLSSSNPLPPSPLETVNPIYKPVNTPSILHPKIPSVIIGNSGGESGIQSSSDYYPYDSSSKPPPFLPLKPIYKSARPSLTLPSSSPNIIRGEGESFTVSQKQFESYPHDQSWKPSLTEFSHQNTIPSYNPEINPEVLASVPPNIIRGTVPDQTLPEGTILRDVFRPEFESRVPHTLEPSIPLQRPSNAINPILYSPNIIRGEVPVAVSDTLLPQSSLSSPFSTATPNSADGGYSFLSDPVDTASPIFTVTEAPPV